MVEESTRLQNRYNKREHKLCQNQFSIVYHRLFCQWPVAERTSVRNKFRIKNVEVIIAGF